MDTSLENATVKQLATLIEKGSLSPVELTEYYLDRIERLDQRLNSFMLITHERARAAAKAAEIAIAGGNYLGPLHSIPFAVKDLVNVAGLPREQGVRPVVAVLYLNGPLPPGAHQGGASGCRGCRSAFRHSLCTPSTFRSALTSAVSRSSPSREVSLSSVSGSLP